MNESMVKPGYRLRLLERFVDYAPDHGRILWREFPKDKIVVDRDTIAFLEARGAPIVRITNP
jgi:hypothetical protein